jgi:hypothetical protein
MSEAVLDLILRARAQGTEALAAVSHELGSVGSASKGAAKDSEKLASEDGKGGVLSGIGSALGSMISPLGLATAGVGALTAIGGAAFSTWKEDEVSIKALDTALKAHGINVQAETSMIEDNAAKYESLGYTVDQVRPVFTALTEAGLTQQQQMTALAPIMDLARAKNIDLQSAAQMYTMAVMGNARAVKQYGIILPPVAASAADVGKAEANLKKAEEAHRIATEQLTITEDALKGKHTLTAAEALKLQQAEQKVSDTTDKVKSAQDALKLAQQGGIDKAARLELVNNALNKAVGGQASSIDNLAPIQAKLSDEWDHFAETVGPLVEKALLLIMTAISDLFDLLGNFIGVLQDVWTWFNKLPTPVQALISPFAMLFAHIGDVVNIIETLIGDLQKIAGIVPGVVNSISKIPGVGLVSGIAGNVGNAIGGLLGGSHATGGIVPGMPGQPMPILAHGGEMVGTPGAPLSGGGGTVHLNVNVAGAAVFDPYGAGAEQIANAIIPGLQRALQRQGVTLA